LKGLEVLEQVIGEDESTRLRAEGTWNSEVIQPPSKSTLIRRTSFWQGEAITLGA
jgi:hypothetical protein